MSQINQHMTRGYSYPCGSFFATKCKYQAKNTALFIHGATIHRNSPAGAPLDPAAVVSVTQGALTVAIYIMCAN